jgi:hypothetical protein
MLLIGTILFFVFFIMIAVAAMQEGWNQDGGGVAMFFFFLFAILLVVVLFNAVGSYNSTIHLTAFYNNTAPNYVKFIETYNAQATKDLAPVGFIDLTRVEQSKKASELISRYIDEINRYNEELRGNRFWNSSPWTWGIWNTPDPSVDYINIQ